MKDFLTLYVVDRSVTAIKIQLCIKSKNVVSFIITLQNPYYCQLFLLSKYNHTIQDSSFKLNV